MMAPSGGASSGASGTTGRAGSAAGGSAAGAVTGASGASNVSGGNGAPASGAGGSTASGGVTATGGAGAANTSGAPNLGGAGGVAAGSGGRGSGGSSPCGATGFHVKDATLYDVNCKEFIMRGVNYPYTWFSTRNYQQDLTAIAATGANTVRLVLSSGGRWTKTSASDLTSLIQAAKAAKLVAVVEVHDTTGYSEQMGSVALTNATSYWTASDIAPALHGQEAFVIINVGNEPNGNDTSNTWASSHEAAVKALRAAGFEHNLMIDAPNWGQDWEGTMRDDKNGAGTTIWNADTEKNLVFSVHMYDVYGMAATITNYFNTFTSKYQAPLVVGEFAADHGSSGDVDEATIMSFAETLGIGYLGWSWAGNGDGLGSLDITNDFDASSLTTWGERLINGQNGIKSTSKPCTCFD